MMHTHAIKCKSMVCIASACTYAVFSRPHKDIHHQLASGHQGKQAVMSTMLLQQSLKRWSVFMETVLVW